jgi:hypothetical protein
VFGETSHLVKEEESSGNSGRSLMKWKSAIGLMALAFGFGGSCLAAKSQTTVVIHAGQLFDGKSDQLASKQVIVIQGERIADVGSEGSIKIPSGAEDIDLSAATVLPGLIEATTTCGRELSETAAPMLQYL